VVLLLIAALGEGPRRYLPALVAPVVLGMALTLFVLSDDCSSCAFVRLLTRIGVIAAGIFLWTTFAELASGVRERAVLALVLGSVVSSLALGLAAGRMLDGEATAGRLVGHGLTVTALLTAGALGSIAVGRSFWSVTTLQEPLETSVGSIGLTEMRSSAEPEVRSTARLPRSHDLLSDRLRCFGLTDRELEVAIPLVEGKKWECIADELNISRNTLKSHVRNIYRKTGARNRQALLLQLLDGGSSG
jgi:DNA-binding CsgD family transcriptional regulator